MKMGMTINLLNMHNNWHGFGVHLWICVLSGIFDQLV